MNFNVKDIRGQINFSFLVAGLGFTSQSHKGFRLPPLRPMLWTGLKSSDVRLPTEVPLPLGYFLQTLSKQKGKCDHRGGSFVQLLAGFCNSKPNQTWSWETGQMILSHHKSFQSREVPRLHKWVVQRYYQGPRFFPFSLYRPQLVGICAHGIQITGTVPSPVDSHSDMGRQENEEHGTLHPF